MLNIRILLISSEVWAWLSTHQSNYGQRLRKLQYARTTDASAGHVAPFNNIKAL